VSANHEKVSARPATLGSRQRVQPSERHVSDVAREAASRLPLSGRMALNSSLTRKLHGSLGATDEDRARCSVYFDRVASNVRDLVLNENLQNKRSHFVLKSIAQCLNSCAVDDVLKLAADASVGAANCYRFGSVNVRVEPLDYHCLGRWPRTLMAASTERC